MLWPGRLRAFRLASSAGFCPYTVGGFGVCLVQQVEVDEFIAGAEVCAGRFLLAHAQHEHPDPAQARGKAGEVAVGGYDAERIKVLLVQQVHRIDDER